MVSERHKRRDEVYLEVYPDHLAPVHKVVNPGLQISASESQIFWEKLFQIAEFEFCCNDLKFFL